MGNLSNIARFSKLFCALGIGSFLSILGPALGIGSGLGLFGGSGSGSGNAAGGQYVPTGRGTADTDWQSALAALSGGIGNQVGQLSPYLNAAFNTEAPQAMNLAGFEGQAGNTMAGNAATAQGLAQVPWNAGLQAFNTATNPQTNMFNQDLQTVQDTANAGGSMRGLGMSAAGAGLTNNATSNFLNQWQNQMVNNAATGMGALSQGVQGATGISNLANNDLTGAAGMYGNSLQQPFNFANMYSGANNQGIYSPYGAMQTNIMPYLNFGMNAASNAFDSGQSNLSNLNSGLSGLSGLFGSGGNNNLNSVVPAGNISNWSGNANPDGGIDWGQ